MTVFGWILFCELSNFVGCAFNSMNEKHIKQSQNS